MFTMFPIYPMSTLLSSFLLTHLCLSSFILFPFLLPCFFMLPVTGTDTKKRSPGSSSNQGSRIIKKAATYSPTLHCSTIGASGLNFSVRNGKRWDPAAITT